MTNNETVIIIYKRNEYVLQTFLTYNFSEDDTRASFMELVEGLGYIEAEDQSTYVLPYNIVLKSTEVIKAIVDWSERKDVHISKEDFVQLFYLLTLTINEKIVTKIASKYMTYNPKTKGLMLKQ